MNDTGPFASVWLVGLVVLCAAGVGCSNKKTEPAAPAAQPMASAQPTAAARPAAANEVSRTLAVEAEPGVAGGVIEETSTVTVTVVDVDRATRKVTLADGAGKRASFTAGSEIRNLDQLNAGDKVTATMKDRLTIYVRPAGAGDTAGATYAAGVAAAPKGDKPGAVLAESYEVVAAVSDIDPARRIATLKFSDGTTRPVEVRPDVDLARYKVGDNVIIRVTSALAVLAAQP
jgi:hypothetical protein